MAVGAPSAGGGASASWNATNLTCATYCHGSTLNAESSAPTYQHADELRRRKIFAQVVECFWKLEPPICGVLRGVFAPRVFVVPLFISEGYFTEEVIPRELGLRIFTGSDADPRRLLAAFADVEQAPLPADVHLDRPGRGPVESDQVVAAGHLSTT